MTLPSILSTRFERREVLVTAPGTRPISMLVTTAVVALDLRGLIPARDGRAYQNAQLTFVLNGGEWFFVGGHAVPFAHARGNWSGLLQLSAEQHAEVIEFAVPQDHPWEDSPAPEVTVTNRSTEHAERTEVTFRLDHEHGWQFERGEFIGRGRTTLSPETNDDHTRTVVASHPRIEDYS